MEKTPAPAIHLPRAQLTYHQQEAVGGYLLLAPVLLVMAGLVVWPFLTAVWISVTDKTIGGGGRFVGLHNFVYLLTWPRFQTALVNSLIFTVAAIAIKFAVGLALALVLNENLPLRTVWRTILLIPWVLPAFVVYLTWRWLYDPLNGLINYALADLGLSTYPIDWLGTKTTAMLAVIIAHAWKGFPFYALAFLAGLQNIPRELYEAASVDGASAWQRFRHITLPGLRHIILVVIMLSTIWTFNAFEPVYLLTGGGPSDATMVYTMLAFDLGITHFRFGEAAAVSVFLLPLLGLYIVVVTQIMREREG